MASDSQASRPDPVGGLFDFKAMIDAMEVARRSWSSMPIPSAMTPTIDPDELDKRIADLKTVEQWLVLNLNLLRGSMQALQLQRDTLSSLQSFGAAARAAAEAAHDTPASGPGSPSAAPGGPAWSGGVDPTVWWQTLQSQFQQVAESALAGMAPAATEATEAPRATPKSTRSRQPGAQSGERSGTRQAAAAAAEPGRRSRQSRR